MAAVVHEVKKVISSKVSVVVTAVLVGSGSINGSANSNISPCSSVSSCVFVVTHIAAFIIAEGAVTCSSKSSNGNSCT